jgi:hypothetical protein
MIASLGTVIAVLTEDRFESFQGMVRMYAYAQGDGSCIESCDHIMDKVLVETARSVLAYGSGQARFDGAVGRILHEEMKTPIIHVSAPVPKKVR